KRDLRLFPCCVCGEAREVRTTKKGKPYMICDPCGVQMFVRVETGIRRFERLVADAAGNNIWKRLAELQHRYQFDCPRCGQKFWLIPELIKTRPSSRTARTKSGSVRSARASRSF